MQEIYFQECYVVDISHDIGLFIWMGNESGKKVREISAKKAEKILKEKKYKHITPVRIFYIHVLNHCFLLLYL